MSHFPSDCSPHASLVPTQTAAASFPPPPQETFLEKHNVKLGFMSVFVKAAAHALQVRLGLEGLAGRVAVAMGVRPQAPCAGALHSAWRDMLRRVARAAAATALDKDGQPAAPLRYTVYCAGVWAGGNAGRDTGVISRTYGLSSTCALCPVSTALRNSTRRRCRRSTP